MIVNAIEFLITILTCLLLVYRNRVEFLMLIFYPMILLNSLMNCNFFGNCLNFLCKESCLLQIGTELFLASQSFCMLLSFLIEVAWTSSTTLNKSSESSYLTAYLRGKIFKLSPLSTKLTVEFLYILLTKLRYFLLFLTF